MILVNERPDMPISVIPPRGRAPSPEGSLPALVKVWEGEGGMAGAGQSYSCWVRKPVNLLLLHLRHILKKACYISGIVAPCLWHWHLCCSKIVCIKWQKLAFMTSPDKCRGFLKVGGASVKWVPPRSDEWLGVSSWANALTHLWMS